MTLLTFLALLTACAREPAPENPAAAARDKRVIYTVNYPLAWLAREIAGDTAEVHFPAPADVDPAFWKPDTEIIARYQQADLILLNGAGYARWTAQASLPESRILDTSRDFHDQLIHEDSGPVHSHGPEGEHSHGEAAFTVWLDPLLFEKQAVTLTAAIVADLPLAQREAIEERLVKTRGTIIKWNTAMSSIASDLDGAPLLYSHPVYQYMERRYRLNGSALHWEPDAMPSDKEWAALDQLLSGHPARIMLWEAEPLPAVAEKLRERDVAVVVYSPQGNRPESGDYATMMRQNLNNLADAIAPGAILSEVAP